MTPNRVMPSISRLVAMGRRMKTSEKFKGNSSLRIDSGSGPRHYWRGSRAPGYERALRSGGYIFSAASHLARLALSFVVALVAFIAFITFTASAAFTAAAWSGVGVAGGALRAGRQAQLAFGHHRRSA